MLSTFCAKYLLDSHSNVEIIHLLVDDGPRKYGSGLEVLGVKYNLPFSIEKDFSAEHVQALLEQIRPDFLFSICNSQILSNRILLSTKQAINFHNSPLPKYAGSNACTWALLNGEIEFGVTFHKISPKIDAGDIFLQKIFPIDEHWSAGELLQSCIKNGLELFQSGVADILDGSCKSTPQDITKRSFHTASSIPNNGWIDFSWSRKKVHDFIRSFSYFPLISPVGAPKARWGEQVIKVGSARIVEVEGDLSEPGKVFVDNEQVFVSLHDGLIELTSILVDDKKRISAPHMVKYLGIHTGAILKGL